MFAICKLKKIQKYLLINTLIYAILNQKKIQNHDYIKANNKRKIVIAN